MSVGEALHQLDGKLPLQVVSLVEARRGEGAARKDMTFLETAGRGIRKSGVDKRNVEEAREKLNEMVEAAQEKWDREAVECEASIRNQKAVREETGEDMSLYRSQNTQAKSDHLRAAGAINTLETTSTKLEFELSQSRASCDEQISQLKGEIAIMVNDSIILQRIVAMTECPKKASFVQCNDSQGNTTTFEKPELRAQMAQLQSAKVKRLLNGAVLLGYETGGTPTPISSRAAFFQQGVKAARALNQRSRVLRGGQEPLGMEPEEEGCSLATNPNCGKLLDKFLEIAGELDSDITVFKMHLENRKAQCELEHENYEAQISDISSRSENWQTALAEATQRSIEANEGERLKRGQYAEVEAQLKTTQDECSVNIANFKSEICALGKIRGELYKMSEVPKFIEDCEVGDWLYGDCNKDCLELPTDKPGIQNLTREVLTPPNLGAKCPPLKLNQICNMVQCPIDCIQSQWSEWSSCSSQCGGGIREKIRSIKRSERFNGEPCGPATETETCNLQNCDKDCVLGQWSKLSSMRCTRACGGGVKWSFREVVANPIGSGTCPGRFAPERYRLSTCNTFPCGTFFTEGNRDSLVCDSKVDVVILLDGSGSLGRKGWAATVAMGEKLVKAFNNPVVKAQARVAVQLFSGPSYWREYRLCNGNPGRRWPQPRRPPDMEKECGIKWVTPLTTDGHFTTDMNKAATAIKSLKWPSRSTFTSMALAQAEAELMYSRGEAQKVVVVVTDGMPINPLKTSVAAKTLKQKARVIWVPVKLKVPENDLNEWATEPTDQNLVKVEDFPTLETPDVVTQIVADVCPDAK